MPYYDRAIQSPSFTVTSTCTVPGCGKNITKSQAVFECSTCKNLYHPHCKGIIGNHITRKAADASWYCSTACESLSGDTTSTVPTSNSNIETVLNTLIARIDQESADVKSMFAEIQKSQNFVCKELDDIKLELTKVTAENKILTEQCRELQEVTKHQTIKVNALESQLDLLYQRDMDNNLIIAGIPDNTNPPDQILRNVFERINCTDALADVISINYITRNRTVHNKTHKNSLDFMILVKFGKPETKQLVQRNKRSIKSMLFANEIGFQIEKDQQIFFRDHLTPYRLQLYRDAQHLKKEHNYKYLWIQNGNILFRKDEGTKIIKITSRNDFEKIQGTNN